MTKSTLNTKRISRRNVARRTSPRLQRQLLVQSLEDRRLLAAGPYAPAAGQEGSTAISVDDPAIVGWASAVADYSPGSNVDAVWTDTSNALGAAEGEFDKIVSLGRGGSLTLTFDTPIRDGLGADFAVFENAINDTFLELGFVEVSSDGINFFRFASDSLTPSAVAAYGEVDATQVNNLAGKYRGGFGTPFDLEELRGTEGLDVTAVTHVRLVDIVGDGLTTDATGDPIYDPTPTIGSAGLDVDGVGVIHQVESGEVVIDFETLGDGLGSATFDNGASGSGGFTEQEISLNNNYSTQYQSWSGWSISQSTDATTAGYTNQFGNVTGGGYDGSETFAVGFFDSSPSDALPPPTITLDPASGSRFDSFYVTNTTYAALSMLNGDSFAGKFGGDNGDDPDFLRLTVTGLDALGNSVGEITVMLGDYRFEDNSQDTILDSWTFVDVSTLSAARSLQFSMDSSDNSPYGMNTPAFFAVDNVTLRRAAVPFDLATAETPENESVVARVSRPTADSTVALDVTLERTGTDRVSLPTTVTIPVGAPYVEFNVIPVNDEIPTPDRTLEITASAENLLPTTRSLLIQEDETLSIAFNKSTVETVEGSGTGAVSLTLTRNDADVSEALDVTLTHDATDLLSVPSTVRFEASQREMTILIDVLDDDVFGSGQTIVVSASAEARETAQVTIVVGEDDLPTLLMSPASIQLSENSPETTRTVTLSRNSANTTQPITVALSLPDGGPLVVPNEVVIEAGKSSATFTVGVIDDAFDNALATYRIGAGNVNFVSAVLSVEVADNDTAGLQIELRDLAGDLITEILEATSFTAIVRRTASSLNVAQEVALSTNLGERVSGVGTVMIPSGSDSAEVTLRVNSDGLVGNAVALTITASATGVTPATASLSVTETDSPSLTITGPEGGLSEADAIAIGDFELLGREIIAGEFDNNAGPSGAFVTGPFELRNSFDNSFGFDFWSGFAVSRGADVTTPGYFNQYSAVTGIGADGSSTYAVAYAGSPATIARVSDRPFASLDITNTTYAALSMRDGDSFAKKFGGESGDDPDFLLLTIDGLDADGNSIGTVDVYLADYRFENNELDYILTDWTSVDVSAIGDAAVLSMSLSSSDNGSFGMNTPAYFAVDNLMLAPEAESLPTITITRNTIDTTEALPVWLTDDRADLILPDMVEIPAGQSSVEVPVTWRDNSLADGDGVWHVDAAADGFIDATTEIVLLDDDDAELTVTLSDESVYESDGVQTVGFEDIGGNLDPQSFNNGADGQGGFTAGSLSFPTAYEPTYGSWSGWAASNMTDVTTAGYTNQFSAYANLDASEPGGGAGGTQTFAVAGGYGASPLTISLPDDFTGGSFESIAITNTTYAALSMLQGDFFAKQFGGESGDDPDFFLLTIEGLDDAGQSAGTIEFYLADYRFEDNSLDYVVDEWTTVDLTSLSGASSLQFTMSSSDVGSFGMNTPAYFAIDDLVIDRATVAEPSMVIHRNSGDVSEELTVTLSSDVPSRVATPQSVVIPAGVDSIRVPLSLIDDAVYKGNQTVQITASAEGFVGMTKSLTLLEDELPSLTVTGPDDGFSESDAVAIGDFELLGRELTVGEFDNNAGPTGAFVTGPFELQNSFDNSFGFDFWSGFAVSRGADVTTPGYFNQYSAVTGIGADGSSTYAVAYAGSPATIARVSDRPFASLDITNTTYAALSMRDGDSFAKKFGGESGDDPDFLLLTIDGLDAGGNSIGTVDVYLADYRFENNELDYILTDWTSVDVSAIGDAAVLSMSLSSSDNGSFGMNTPAYFAVDNLMLAPETESLPTITITRNTLDTTEALPVWLTDDRADLILPDRVEIPAGQSSVEVPVTWRDNSIADGDGVWHVDASAVGFIDATAEIALLDDDDAELTVTLSSELVNESDGVQTVGFEDIGGDLDPQSFNNGADGQGGFTAGSLSFPTAYEPTFGSWSGWAASNMTDVVTAGFTNQFSAYANPDASEPGGGADGSQTFAVAGGYGASPLTISLPEDFTGGSFESIAITNTTYAALSMLQGDFFAKQFGGESGDDPDFFLLTIEGFDDAGESAGTIEFYLADYRFEDNSLDHVVNEWTTVDLTSLSGASSLQFTMSSSDVGSFGMNTPAYFAIDDLVIDRATVAEPSMVIHRNSGDVSEELTVTLSSNVPSRVATPQSVVIPAGVDSIRVPLSLIDDAVYEGDQTVQIIASAEGFVGTTKSLTLLEDDLPSELTLGRVGDTNQLFGASSDPVFAEYADDADIDLILSNGPQQFTLEAVVAASVNVALSGGSDTAWVNSKSFNRIDGGSGIDTAILSPTDLAEGESVDVATWLSERVVGFENVVLGSSTMDGDSPSLQFDLDAVKLAELLGGSVPSIVTAAGQSLNWIGEWRIGTPMIENGVLTARVIGEGIEVIVATDLPWRNVVLNADVNASGDVTAVDALAIINRLNADDSFDLPLPETSAEFVGIYYDVSGDGIVTSLDALQVINWLNVHDGGAASAEPTPSDLTAAPQSMAIAATTAGVMGSTPVSTATTSLVAVDGGVVTGSSSPIEAPPTTQSALPVEILGVDDSASAANRIDPAVADIALSDLELLSTAFSLQSEIQR
ncbi:DUF4465 domain-containing protein [Aporhodopirellula aestuarii]|uniref:DUF4465 domain-containing protein n=1 Tax=Aporhodopirellula aestuarii TaxID=2950107 RepID=A0ABT0TZ91_9BACT|nr:DUF4465 domain-containing protein [Aporhodopirellula aestuarii]MCM2369563.1 DUF4465 domain-containing protein [Aporhodopirellula aestuarii]